MKYFLVLVLFFNTAICYASGISSTSNYNPTAVTITGGSGAFTGEVSATGGTGGKITLQASTGDVIATRAGGATGGIFFNTDKTRYLYWDGASYFMVGGGINVVSLVTTGSISAGGISGTIGSFSGAIFGTSASFSGGVSGTTGAFSGGVLSSSPTAPIGYSAGSGGSVTQITSNTTPVTLSKVSGEIVMISATYTLNTPVSFTLSNTLVGANTLCMAHMSGWAGTLSEALVQVTSAGLQSCRFTVYPIVGAGTGVYTIRFSLYEGSKV